MLVFDKYANQVKHSLTFCESLPQVWTDRGNEDWSQVICSKGGAE